MNLFQSLLLLFILIPLLEISLFITVGNMIGGFSTVLLVIFTAVLGAYLLRIQGIATLQKMHDTLQQGQVPTETLFEGILLLFGGVLLLTPGFFTDTVGFICLIPKARQYLIYWLRRHIQTKSFTSKPAKQATTIEGEYRREDE